MANKDSALFVRITEEDKEALNRIAAERDIPAAQIVREAVREKIAELRPRRVEEAHAAA
jgi:predicted DNA-binding protein